MDIVAKAAIETSKNSKRKCGTSMTENTFERQNIRRLKKGQTKFGEIPWQAAILRKEGDSHIYLCSASLIDDSHLLTAAHCVNSYNPSDLILRLGEWDVDEASEYYTHLELNIVGVAIHPDYFEGNLANDVALIRTLYPVDLNDSPHVLPVCVPTESDHLNSQCIVTGWGKDAFGQDGLYQSQLRKVEVPLVSNEKCQNSLRRTKLGSTFKLHPGMICAGGEVDKDACKGDGGGPLNCLNKYGRYVLTGIVSWGIGCGQEGLPGVYTNVKYYMPWVKDIINS